MWAPFLRMSFSKVSDGVEMHPVKVRPVLSENAEEKQGVNEKLAIEMFDENGISAVDVILHVDHIYKVSHSSGLSTRSTSSILKLPPEHTALIISLDWSWTRKGNRSQKLARTSRTCLTAPPTATGSFFKTWKYPYLTALTVTQL